jgi:hypothetical protein
MMIEKRIASEAEEAAKIEAIEKAGSAADAAKVRMNQIADAHNDFIQRVRDGKFHGLKPESVTIVMSIIPVGEPQKINLKEQYYKIREKMMFLTEGNGGWDSFPSVGAIVSRGRKIINFVQMAELQSVTEVTDKGHVHFASIIPVFDIYEGKRITCLFGQHEGKMMHAGGEAVRLLMQVFGFKPPFMVGIALLNAEGVVLLQDNSIGRDSRAATENNIVPDQCSVNITCEPADYSNTVIQFAKGVRQPLDMIWQHAGQFGDTHYNDEGLFQGY